MAPYVNAARWLKVSSDDLDGADFWWAARPWLQVRADTLSIELEQLIRNLMHQSHPGRPQALLDMMAGTYAVCMQLDNPNTVYVHVGPYTPNSEERFSLGKLRAGGTGIKRLGVPSASANTWQDGLLTGQQEEVMQRLLDFMDDVAAEMQQQQQQQQAHFGALAGLAGLMVPPPNMPMLIHAQQPEDDDANNAGVIIVELDNFDEA